MQKPSWKQINILNRQRHMTAFEAAQRLGLPYQRFLILLLCENKKYKLAQKTPTGWKINANAVDRLAKAGVPDFKWTSQTYPRR